MMQMARAAIGAIVLVAIVSSTASGPLAQDTMFAGRPAFSWGDQPAQGAASCGELRAMADGLPETDERVDLTVKGELVLVRTDGVLWYLGLCAPPGIRVLCVAYQSNDMRVGDTVYMKGGYRRAGPDHILLDPCLANRPENGEPPAAEPGRK